MFFRFKIDIKNRISQRTNGIFSNSSHTHTHTHHQTYGYKWTENKFLSYLEIAAGTRIKSTRNRCRVNCWVGRTAIGIMMQHQLHSAHTNTPGPISISIQCAFFVRHSRFGQISPRQKREKINFVLPKCQFTSIKRDAIENVWKFHLNSIFLFRNEFLFPSFTLRRQLYELRIEQLLHSGRCYLL